MAHTVEVTCPHCGHPQKKQTTSVFSPEFTCIGVRTCENTQGGCGNEYVIYARSTLAIKTKKVVEE